MKKIISILTILLIVLSISTSIFAATTSKLTLELVEDKVCTILLEDSGKLEKRLISISDENKEAILQITVENTKTVETQILPSEIFFVIDNSDSMIKNEVDDGVTRKDAVVSAAKTLAEKLLTVQPSTKIGVVSFSSASQVEQEGTINDAKLQLLPTSTLSDITSAIDGISYTGPRTNIEAGLTVAESNFSKDENNKAVILLTDGVPNNAVGGPTLIYSTAVAKKTSAKLKDLDNAGIKVISVMTGVSDTLCPYDELTVPEGEEIKTYKQLAEDVFGTEKYPYVGKFYFIDDSEINTTITRDVFNNVIITKENYIKDIEIVDYFPEEIINNYDFEIVEDANIGKIDSVVNPEDNSITWRIETLNVGEIAKVQYKLKLKKDFDRKIIDVVMPTNKNVDVTFTDVDNTPKDVSSTDSPTIVLKQYVTDIPDPKPEPEPPKVIPQAGSNVEGFLITAGVILTGAIVSFIVYVKKYRF